MAFAALLCVFASPVFGQRSGPTDGNWWMSIPLNGPPAQVARNRLVKSWYVTGVLDGVVGVADDLVIEPAVEAHDERTAEQRRADYRRTVDHYIKNVAQAQIIDGLTAFYQNFRNRRILVGVAISVVLRQIAGAPESEIDKLVDTLRRNAVK